MTLPAPATLTGAAALAAAPAAKLKAITRAFIRKLPIITSLLKMEETRPHMQSRDDDAKKFANALSPLGV
ncbi:MAG: hypothetical protein ABIY40_05055 [Rhodanobacteraceae bacterium]